MKIFKKLVEWMVELGEARARHLANNPSLMRWY